MDNIKKFKLIEGEFTAADAKEMLLSLIGNKIQFHYHKIFGKEVRFGEKDEHSVTRVHQLTQSRQEVLELIAEAKKNNKRLVISSHVTIEILD
jgi:hypothetical protein